MIEVICGDLVKKRLSKVIEAVIFDLDGVLINSPLDFNIISREIFGVVDSQPILEKIEALGNEEEKMRAHQILEGHEKKASFRAELTCGVRELFTFLEKRQIKKAVVTRNSRQTVKIVSEKFGFSFDVIVTRQDAPPKPSAEPILLACRKMKVSPQATLFLGDYEFDMLSGWRAGVLSVLLRSQLQFSSPHAHVAIDSLRDLRELITRDTQV